MNLQPLRRLLATSELPQGADRIAGCLLALGEGAPPPHGTCRWVALRLDRLAYPDPMMVDSRAAGCQRDSSLDEDMFAHTRSHGVGTITKAFTVQSPNLASKSLHDTFGLRELGLHRVAAGTKRVSLQATRL